MGMRKNAVEIGVGMKMSRTMDESLTTMSRYWRYRLYDEEIMTPWFDVHRRDAVEILISWLYFHFRGEDDIKTWPPMYLFSEEFMWKALECRLTECIDSFDLDAFLEAQEEKRLEDMEEDRTDRLIAEADRILAGGKPDPNFDVGPMPYIGRPPGEEV